MKKRGDPRHTVFPTFSDLVAKVATDLSVQDDPKFKRFWNFKPFPATHNWWRNTTRTNVLVGANKCIAGDTMIYDPAARRLRKISETKSGWTVYAWNGKSLVPARALKPFVKGYDRMLEVSFSNGKTLRCTRNHLIMDDQMDYRPVGKMQEGDCVFLPGSISGIGLLALWKDADGLKKTIQDCQNHCSTESRQYDGRFQKDQENAEDGFPLPTGVKEHIVYGSSFYRWILFFLRRLKRDKLDAKEQKLQCNDLCSFAHHLSKVCSFLLDGGLSCLESLNQVFLRVQDVWKNNSFRHQSVSQFQFEAIPHVYIAQSVPGFEQHDPQTISSSTPYMGLINQHPTIITSIRESVKGLEPVWDFEVPKWHNYLAAGVINHNSGKTTTSIFKAICIYTGMVPPGVRDLWDVDMPINRSRRIRIICQDYTKHWPETIKPLLLSEDFGMLPDAWSKNYDPDEHIFYGPDESMLSIMAINPREAVDPNVLRGPLIDHTYIDEKQQRTIYTETLVRSASLREGPRSVDLGYCPQDGYDWTWEDFFCRAYNPQTLKRRPDEEQPPELNVLRISMRDNPSIRRTDIDEFVASLKPWEIAYRVDGNYAQATGNPYFNLDIIHEWRKAGKFKRGDLYQVKRTAEDVEDGDFQGRLEKVKGIVPDYSRNNIWQVWEPPKDGEYYMMTVDTAEGNPKSDFQVADIWRCSEDGSITTSRPVQVAQFRKRLIRPGELIIECCCMANVYGDCLLVYETNNTSGGTVRDRSRNYVNLYRRVMGRTEIERQSETLGWHTDYMSKPSALEEADKLMKIWAMSGDGFVGIRSPHTADDMMTFEETVEKNTKGVNIRTYGAQHGSFDDCVTTFFMMAYVLRLQNEMLTIANISPDNTVKPYESSLEKKAQSVPKRFSALRKQPSLRQLRPVTR